MVDFSCALKLAMPIAVLSAIREANLHHITVKGGKYLEAAAAADTIVFDKTGTLTKAQPTVKDVVVFCDSDKDEMLRIAHVWKSIFLILWPRLWLRRRNGAVWIMKRCIQKSIIL